MSHPRESNIIFSEKNTPDSTRLAHRHALRYIVADKKTTPIFWRHHFMAMNPKQIRTHIFTVIINKVEEQDEDKRQEALTEFMSVTGTAGNAPDQIAEMIPPIMHDLYEKWISMFIDRLLETVDARNLELLCDGTTDNNAALVLAYIMFLESARMEEQIPKDLAEHGLKASGNEDLGDLAASYIRTQMSKIAEQAGDKEPKGNA
ncbi:hypothetical protein [uncultured Pseudodesulfovibrio sp.]|uniref:hypothetical protein n=1 Tax=uncultured Pseudodesulfovibrio sp. TaxID=2035858 RepID=UPI00374A7640